MAEVIAGSEEGFVTLMNARAKELNMNNTNFVNCTGLPQPGQYSCAKDCALMLSRLLTHKNYYKYSRIWMDKINHSGGRVTEITNTNKLVRFYKGCDGGKTGYTSEAKHCISATAERGGMRLISVIIGAEDSKNKVFEASRLLNFGLPTLPATACF
jgi:D-alanyl-D-alanine carboxypeptidase (penicillin-binding protein 5/6)